MQPLFVGHDLTSAGLLENTTTTSNLATTTFVRGASLKVEGRNCKAHMDSNNKNRADI